MIYEKYNIFTTTTKLICNFNAKNIQLRLDKKYYSS